MSQMRWFQIEGLTLRVAQEGGARQLVARTHEAGGEITPEVAGGLIRAGFVRLPGQAEYVRETSGLTVGVLRSALGERVAEVVVDTAEVIGEPVRVVPKGVVALQSRLRMMDSVAELSPGREERGKRALQALASVIGGDEAAQKAAAARWARFAEAWDGATDAAAIAEAMVEETRRRVAELEVPALDAAVQTPADAAARLRAWRTEWLVATGDLDEAEEFAHDTEAVAGASLLGAEVWERVGAVRAALDEANVAHAQRMEALNAWRPWSGEGANPPPRGDLDLVPGNDRWRPAQVGGRTVWTHPWVVDLGTTPIEGIEAAVDPTAVSRGDVAWLLPSRTEPLEALAPLASLGEGKEAFVAYGRGSRISLVNRPAALHLLSRYPGGEFCCSVFTRGRVWYLHQGEVVAVVAETAPGIGGGIAAIAAAAEAGLRRRVTTELARELRFGDVLIDDEGRFWQSQNLRGFVLRAREIRNDQLVGEPVSFLLEPERAEAYPYLANAPLFVMGRVWRGEERREPDPVEFEPDAFHEAMVRWQAHRLRGGLDAARAAFDTERQRAVHGATWEEAVRVAALDGRAVPSSVREIWERRRGEALPSPAGASAKADGVGEIQVGDRVRFVPSDDRELRFKYANRDGRAEPIEGVAVAVDRTSSGNLRVRVRTDEDAAQGGGKLEKIVYSHEGVLESLSGPQATAQAEDVLAAIPPRVRRQVEWALATVREGERGLAEIERVLGRFSAEQAYERVLQSTAGAERVIAEFTERAAANGVDADRVFAALGGRPDLAAFAPKDAAGEAHRQVPEPGADARPGTVNAMMGLDGYTESEASALTAAGFRKTRAKDNIGQWISRPFAEGRRRFSIFKMGDRFFASIESGSGWREGRDVANGALDEVLSTLRSGFPGALPTEAAQVEEPALREAAESPPSAGAAAFERSVTVDAGTYVGVPEGAPEEGLDQLAAARIEPHGAGWRAVLLPEGTEVADGDRSAVEAALQGELDAMSAGEPEHYVVEDGERRLSLLPVSPARWRASGGDGAMPEGIEALALWQEASGRRWEHGTWPALRPTASLATGAAVRVDSWTERVGPASASNPGRRSKDRIEDFGEKIGGARKDLARLRGARLMVSDTEGWSADEKRDLVTKDRIWPAPDWTRVIAEGMDPAVAYAIKAVRETIRSCWVIAGPRRRYLWNEASALEWHAAVADAAECFEGVKTREDFTVALRNFVQSSMKGQWTSTRFTERGEALSRTAGRGQRVSLFKLEDLAWDPGSVEGAERFAEGWARWEATRAREGWPDCLQRRAARRGASTVVEVRPQLANIERVGPDYRAGADVTPETMLETFGLRGGEWGEWTSQADRRQTLNHAFDALMDLSAVLQVPPAAIGLGGELAVAFGARGTGGRRAAAAHYEPYRRVINLTKMSGAGSLAHEFGHALDDHLGRVTGCRSSTQHPWFSQWVQAKLPRHGARPEVDAAMVGLVDRMMMRPETDAEWQARRQSKREALQRVLTFADTQLARVRMNAQHELCLLMSKEASESVLARLDSAIGVVLAASRGGYEAWKRLPTKALHADVFDALQAARRVCGSRDRKPAPWVGAFLGVVTQLDEAHTWLHAASTDSLSAERWSFTSDYRLAAGALDEGRSKPYYSQTIEMFARAFECWAFDTLQKKGWRSDYLVHGVEPARYAVTEPHRTNRNPYPAGAEREAINGCFDTLASALKTELDASGKMRLYARGGLLPDLGLSAEQVNVLVMPIRRALAGRCEVAVVQSVDELPIDSPSDVRGAFTPSPPTAWLVADNLGSGLEVERTLAHEVLRHAGLWAALGSERESILTEIWASNPSVRAEADALRRNSLADGVPLSRLEATEEALAGLADRGELGQVRGIERLLAAMRDLLRTLGFGRLVGAWSDADVGYVLDRAERAMPWPKTAVEQMQDHESAAVPLRAMGMGMGS